MTYRLIPLGRGGRGGSSGRGGVKNSGLWWSEWASERGRLCLPSSILSLFLHRRRGLSCWSLKEADCGDEGGYGWLNGGCWRRERDVGSSVSRERS